MWFISYMDPWIHPNHHRKQHLYRVGHFGPILWGHSGPLCHALSLLLLLWTSILHCHSPGVATVTRRLHYSYSWLRLILVVVSIVATPGEWQCKIRTGGVAVANGPNNFSNASCSTIYVHYQSTNRQTDKTITVVDW